MLSLRLEELSAIESLAGTMVLPFSLQQDPQASRSQSAAGSPASDD